MKAQMRTRIVAIATALIGFTTLLLSALPSISQELQPRRWSHLPTGLNFAGAGYVYTEADISDTPALRLEDVSTPE